VSIVDPSPEVRDPPYAPSPVRPRRPRWRGPALLAVVVLGVVWGALAGVTVGLAYLDLHQARDTFRGAAATLSAADLAGSRAELDDGVAHSRRASSRLHQPQMAPLRVLPWIGDNLRAVTARSDASLHTGEAASELLAVASTIVHDEREAVHGEVSLSYLGDLVVPLRELSDAMVTSTAAVEETGTGLLVGPVSRARATYLATVGPLTEQAVVAAEVAEMLPRLLGEDEPRTYLVVGGSLSELRASGGLMGSWSTLVADAGHLDVGDFAGVDELSSLAGDVASPSEDFTRRYGPHGALREWRNTNLTPDFPTAAEVMLRMWEEQRSTPLDGVIMVDPVVFEGVAERAGALEVPGVATLQPEELLRFVGLDAYAAFDDHDERKHVLGEVATSAFATALEILEDDDVPRTVELLHGLADGGHLRVYSRDDEVQATLRRAGIAGEIPDVEGEFAGIFVNNVAANKVDWFTFRSIDHRVRLLPDGRTDGLVTLELDNEAPRSGHPRYVLGPWTPHTEAGDNLSLVSFLCGPRCAFDPLPDGMVDGGREQGLPVVDVSLLLPAGEKRTVQYHTQTDDGWMVEDDEVVVRVTHLVQPTLEDTPLRVRLAPPPDWEVTQLPEGAELVDEEIVWEAATSGLVELTFRLLPPEAR
jgi:hypothetical protein